MASSSPSIASNNLADVQCMQPGEEFELESLLSEVRSTSSAVSQQTAAGSHSPHSSSSQADLESPPNHKKTKMSLAPITTPYWRPWAAEIFSMIMSLLLLAAVVAILAAFDGVPQPYWGTGISLNLNSLIAIISTLCRATLMLVVAEVISYLKWRWFRDTRPLSDLETIHRASLGLWGSTCLLFSGIRHALVIIAALLVILLAAFGPFTQQAIRSFVCRIQVLPSNEASVPVAHYLGDYLKHVDDDHLTSVDGSIYFHAENDFRLGNSMKSAILDAMTAKDAGTNKLAFTCPTGDCTFKLGPTGSAYSSIGLCNECFDITSLVQEWPGQYEKTNTQGNKLNLTLEGLVSAQTSIYGTATGKWSSITSHEPSANKYAAWGLKLGSVSQNITYLTYTWASCTINQTEPVLEDAIGGSKSFYNWICPTSSYPNIPHMNEDVAVLAVNCTFFPCIRSYNARVETGILRETPVSHVRMEVDEILGDWTNPWLFLEPCFVDGLSYSHSNISLASNATGHNFTTLWTPRGNLRAPTECIFHISYEFLQALSQYFRTDFFGNHQCRWDSHYYWYNISWVTCPNEVWWLDSLFNRGFATFESVDSLLQNISLAVSNQMRAHGTNANRTAPEFASGTMWNSTVCTRVDWAWMALPVSLELLTLVLLVTAITMSLRDHGRYPTWKSSILPLVFHGIRDIKDALGNAEPPASDATSTVSVPIDVASMEKLSKTLPVRLSTKLGSSGFVVDHTSVRQRESSETHEATP